MKQPVDHIERPRLPWRCDEPGLTECGYDASKVKTLTRDEFFQRLKDYGQQRAAMLTCMTCSDTARRWQTWEQDPRQALSREITWERGEGYRPRGDRGGRLKDELVAIAQIISENRDRFTSIVSEIAERRAWNERKAEIARRPKAREPGSL